MGLTTPEIRRLMVRFRRKGKKIKDIVYMFSVSRYTVWRWVKRVHYRGGKSFKDKSKRHILFIEK
jgi:transposase